MLTKVSRFIKLITILTFSFFVKSTLVRRSHKDNTRLALSTMIQNVCLVEFIFRRTNNALVCADRQWRRFPRFVRYALELSNVFWWHLCASVEFSFFPFFCNIKRTVVLDYPSRINRWSYPDSLHNAFTFDLSKVTAREIKGDISWVYFFRH